MKAYILVNCAPHKLWEIAERALKIDGVKMAHPVTGEFDVVAYAEFVDMVSLRKIVDEFQSLEGITRTQTAIVMPLRLH